MVMKPSSPDLGHHVHSPALDPGATCSAHEFTHRTFQPAHRAEKTRVDVPESRRSGLAHLLLRLPHPCVLCKGGNSAQAHHATGTPIHFNRAGCCSLTTTGPFSS